MSNKILVIFQNGKTRMDTEGGLIDVFHDSKDIVKKIRGMEPGKMLAIHMDGGTLHIMRVKP